MTLEVLNDLNIYLGKEAVISPGNGEYNGIICSIYAFRETVSTYVVGQAHEICLSRCLFSEWYKYFNICR